MSRARIGKDDLICDRVPHEDNAHHATVAMLLHPTQLNQMRSPKWIHGTITWMDAH